MKKAFVCPKMAVRLIFVGASSFAFLCFILASFFSNFEKYAVISLVLVVILEIIAFLTFIKNSGFGMSIFRSLIVVKFNEREIKNKFCSIKFDEIETIKIEQIEFKKFFYDSTSKRLRDCGLVLIISKNKESNLTFKDFSLKDSICLPYSKKTIELIEAIVKMKTGDGVF